MDIDLIKRATGGLSEITSDSQESPDFASPSKLRPLIFEDPGLIWLSEFGGDNGYKRDGGKYRLLPYLAKLGAEFEKTYIEHEAPDAVRLLKSNAEVHKKEAFEKTLEHLERGTAFMWQAALWWHPEQVFGIADCIVSTDKWLYKRYPHLKPLVDEPPHHCIIEFKYSQNLTGSSTAKKNSLQHAITQTRIYSYILGHLQGHMPRRAYIISRDSLDAPLIVDVNLELNQPLDDEICDLRDAYFDIKNHGASLRPWKDERVRLNPQNTSDEPYSDAKKQIIKENVRPRSLLMLPGVGPELARKMRHHGFKDVDDLLSRNIDRLRFEDVEGISNAMGNRLRAILKANKTGKPSPIPSHLVPPKRDVSIMFDLEYMNSLKADFSDYPNLGGSKQIFMIGCLYKEKGKNVFKRFTSEDDTFEAEGKMLRQFLKWCRKMGVFDPSKTAALYHWSSAEVWQANQAAERHGLSQLAKLPLVDLRELFVDGCVCFPGCWNFGLKEIAAAIGEYANRYKVEWPDGMSGQAAMIAAYEAYEDDAPARNPIMSEIASYLRVDCLALERVLSFCRRYKQPATKISDVHIGWYRRSEVASIFPIYNGTGWYRVAIAKCE